MSTPLISIATWRRSLIHGSIVLVAAGLSVAGWYLPWMAFVIDGQHKQLGPASILADMSTPPGVAPNQPSLSSDTIGLVIVLILFGAALSLIFVPQIMHMSTRQMLQALVGRVLTFAARCAMIIDLSLIFLMFLFLGFDDADTGATDFHYAIGVACVLASIVLAAGHLFFTRWVDNAIARKWRPQPQKTDDRQ